MAVTSSDFYNSDVSSALSDNQHPAKKRVRILPPHLVNKIAAGEVVERPASVVKELVENALDAGATRIEIHASDAGRTLRISDNGSGMDAEDARLAFCNHATSKITSEEDLNGIHTLGFRGEALASISVISRLTCLTRTAEAANGLKVTFEPNNVEPFLISAGCSVGTVMEIAELFYNTPARLKFLKRPSTEFGHIEETVQSLAMSHPEVRFKLFCNEKKVLETKGDGDLKHAIHDIFRLDRDPVELAEIAFADDHTGYAISGFTSVPGIMKNSKRWLVTFINGRTVRCHLLQKAIESAYDALLPHGRYPLCVFHLTLPLAELDVNVHPTKREVRYASNQTVFSFVQVAIKRALEQQGYKSYSFQQQTPENVPESSSNIYPLNQGFPNIRPVPSVDSDVRWPYRESGAVANQHRLNYAGQNFAAVDGPLNRAAFDLQSPLSNQSEIEDSQDNVPNADMLPRYRVLGQLYNTYILLETAQGLMVVDQHIASERELFEKISLKMLSETPPTQHCMLQTPIVLSPNQLDLLSQNQATFEKLGFFYKLCEDGQSVQLTGIPLIYQEKAPNQQPQALFEDLLGQLEATGSANLDSDATVNHLIATLACHSAVRAGDPLANDDMGKVIEGWLTSKLPWTCPHGRPIAHTINKEELNKFFHRPSLPVNSF